MMHYLSKMTFITTERTFKEQGMVGSKLAPYLTENSDNYVNRKSLQLGTLDDASFKTSANLDSYIINRVNRSMTK